MQGRISTDPKKECSDVFDQYYFTLRGEKDSLFVFQIDFMFPVLIEYRIYVIPIICYAFLLSVN